MSGLLFSVGFLIALYVYYTYENSRRDFLYGFPEAITVGEQLQNELSNKTDREIDGFRYIV